MSQRPSYVSIRHLYKIFGPNPAEIISFARAGMTKDEMQNTYGHVLGLRDINIEVKRGEITVIMGLSGSGKSTLIRHVNRLIEPTYGEIVLDSIDVTKLNATELRELRRSKISMVFQKFGLLPHETVIQNTTMPCSVRNENRAKSIETARHWLARVGLSGAENMYPHELSGGMQQRVGLARALTSDCELMLMDEAYSALDPLIRSSMQDLLLRLQQDLHKTIVFITHDLDEALKIADHLVILKDGEIVQQGDPQVILLKPATGYVQDFVRDINRSRVLRVRSIMESPSSDQSAEVIHANATLEEAINLSNGDVGKTLTVTLDGVPVGQLRMTEVLRALVRI